MEQLLFYVNCPYCGHVVEVICPYLDREVKVVWPKKKGSADLQGYSFKKMNVCTKCSSEMMIYWKT